MKRTHLRGMWKALRENGGHVAYCAGIALALTAIAFAAEGYRNRHGDSEAGPALPALEQPALEAEVEPAEPLRAPEGAELLRAFCAVPEWNAELRQWETHLAVDYRTRDGGVECLCAGTVRAVGKSGAHGGFVEIECGELLMRYASVSPREGLEPGDALEAGDPIGTADASMAGESGLGAHLHLEAERAGAPVDFEALVRGD